MRPHQQQRFHAPWAEDLEADVAVGDSLRDRAAATSNEAKGHHAEADRYEHIAVDEAREAKIVLMRRGGDR